MERGKARGGNTRDDQMDLVKAAAWAWYQHGSGSDSRSMREYYVTRNQRIDKPSRYKLEAIKEIQEQSKTVSSSATTPPSPVHLHGDISLFDKYEIDRISRQLDHYIKSSHAKYYGNYEEMSEKDALKETKVKQREKKSGGFWSRHAVVCGSKNDIVIDATSSAVSSRWSGGHATVVSGAQCRPRLRVKSRSQT